MSVDVEAAGGVVMRQTANGPEVLIVHRPRYDDWGLPKGKLDAGEDHASAARREVAEETGVQGTVISELPEVEYEVAAGTKRVRWFVLAPAGGDPADRPPDDEIDEARWIGVAEAHATLTYATERSTLAAAMRAVS